jgi:hypothetical protein
VLFKLTKTMGSGGFVGRILHGYCSQKESRGSSIIIYPCLVMCPFCYNQYRVGSYILSCCQGRIRIRMDPDKIWLLDTDPYSKCGSWSRIFIYKNLPFVLKECRDIRTWYLQNFILDFGSAWICIRLANYIRILDTACCCIGNCEPTGNVPVSRFLYSDVESAGKVPGHHHPGDNYFLIDSYSCE